MRFLTTFDVLLAAVVLLTAGAQQASGQAARFPYQARVVDAEVFVRSGAGESWLPTQRLQQNAVVTVLRHDPGGWYMIEPPEGSFSWIPARFVREQNDAEGEVTENNAVAFVGSDFGDDTTVWQRALLAGEKVKILGRRELRTPSGNQQMLKIAPPRREFRWIPGGSVVPVDEERRRQMDHDPYATPSNAARPGTPDSNSPVAGNGGVTDVPPLDPDSQLARLRTIRSEQRQLSEIDQQFRDMIFQDPSTWNLEQIEQAYQSLQKSSTYKPVAGQIDLRYPAIERYRRKLAEFEDFKRLTSETERRDAQIVASVGRGFGPPAANAAGQNPVRPFGFGPSNTERSAVAFQPPMTAVESGGVVQNEPEPFHLILGASENASPVDSQGPVPSDQSDQSTGFPALTFPSEQSASGWEYVGGAGEMPVGSLSVTPVSGLSVPGTMTDAAVMTNSDPMAAAPEHASRYAGAGVLRRSALNSETPYVLTTPSGRILANVKPDLSVNAESFIGQPVGLQGRRIHRDQPQVDLIEVSGLELVRLRE